MYTLLSGARSIELGLAHLPRHLRTAALSSGGAAVAAPMRKAVLLGQGTFRVAVTDLYGRRCAVSGEKTLPILDAAHIRPYADGGPHSVNNGLLPCAREARRGGRSPCAITQRLTARRSAHSIGVSLRWDIVCKLLNLALLPRRAFFCDLPGMVYGSKCRLVAAVSRSARWAGTVRMRSRPELRPPSPHRPEIDRTAGCS
jgi:hypothetical protein